MTVQAIQIEGKDYVIVPRDEFDQFNRLRSLYDSSELPSLPEPDAKGRYPAVEYSRISLARKIIRDRVSLGLLREDLARLAGIRMATLSRIESGTMTPSAAAIERIDAALKAADKKARPKQH
jgi:DNA-binding XRE family transcriptional regulator